MQTLTKVLLLLYLQTSHGWFFPSLPEPGRDLEEEAGVLSNLLGGISSIFSRTLPHSPRSPGSEFDHRKLAQGERISLEECKKGCTEETGKPLTCGSLAHRRQGGRIVNGKPSGHSKHPWAVKVLHRDRPLCGASLVTAVFVVSAAHCFYGARNKDFTLELGSGEALVTRRIGELFIRSDFVRRSYDNDIALVRMDKEVTFNLLVRPVCLPSMVDEMAGMEGTVVGWGLLKQNGNIPDGLQAIQLPIIPRNTCRLMSRHQQNAITDNMFCAGFMDGSGDACQGDSGGPFLVTGDNSVVSLAGIVSWGIGCARRDYPGVYTRLPIFLPWIAEILRSNDSCVCERRSSPMSSGRQRGKGKLPTVQLQVEILKKRLKTIEASGGDEIEILSKQLLEKGIKMENLKRWLEEVGKTNS